MCINYSDNVSAMHCEPASFVVRHMCVCEVDARYVRVYGVANH